MAKHRVTFEVDNIILFDMLREVHGNPDGIGQRVAGVFLTGNCDFREALGLAVFGITFIGTEKIEGEARAALESTKP